MQSWNHLFKFRKQNIDESGNGLLELGTLSHFFKTVSGKWSQFFVLKSVVSIKSDVKIRGEDSCNGFGINFVSFCFTKRKWFSELTGLKRIDDKGRQLLTEKEPQNVVGIMPGSFKSDFNFIVITRSNFVIKILKAVKIVDNRKSFIKNVAFKSAYKTFVIILCNIDTD